MEKIKELITVIAIGIKNRLFPSTQYKRVRAWQSMNKDGRLLYDYDIDHTAVVFDVGGYKGEWASKIFCRYNCEIFVFEPVRTFFTEIRQKFSHNNRVHIEHSGLGGHSSTVAIAVNDDGSSLFKQSSQTETCEIIDIVDYLNRKNINRVALLKLNIEGAEFDLLERLIDSGSITKVDNVLVQFHDFTPDADARMATLRTKLASTHNNIFAAEYVWEHWKIR